jgi:hypothetical protein
MILKIENYLKSAGDGKVSCIKRRMKMNKEMNTEFELFYKEHGTKIENLGLYELHKELCQMQDKKPKSFIGFCEAMFHLNKKKQ